MFTDKHGEFLAELKTVRKRVIENVPDPTARKDLLEQLVDDNSFECFIQNGSAQWQEYAAGLMRTVS